ncbi:hypothetical protein GOV05_05495 [Candidatus Woesearchaeota archaeon]|nr:hypothetical protein [Candidatus Woesearchaeota archaeon]
MSRGDAKSNFLLVINIISLILIVALTAISDLDANIGLLLLGFSPSILAIVITAFVKNKTREGYVFLIIPFMVISFFIIISIIFLNPLVEKMDVQALSAINFAFTLLFGFAYYIFTPIKKKTQKREFVVEKKVDEPVNEEVIEEEGFEDEEKEERVVHEHVIHHVHEHKEEDPKIREYLSELKEAFNIVNVDSEEILSALKELKVEREKKHEEKIPSVHDMLEKLEENKIFFASTTGEKYHNPMCIVINNIHKDKITAFKSEEEAQKQGYTPCNVCMPEK